MKEIQTSQKDLAARSAVQDRSVSTPVGQLHLGLVIDRSGSMDHLQTAVVQSVNKLVAKQRELSSGAQVSLRLFNNEVKEIFSAPIDNVRPLTNADFRPTGGTALLDAIGSAIDAVAIKVGTGSRTPVVIAICSDGEENASQIYSRTEVLNQVISRRFAHGWQFLFLSCSEAARKFALDLGFQAEAIIEFDAAPAGLAAILDRFSQALKNYRLGDKRALLALNDRKP